MNYRILFFTICIFFTAIVFYKVTHAFFTSNQVISGNTITTASISPTPSASPTPLPARIVINEVYYRVDQNHRIGSEAGSEWAELYNGGGSSITFAAISLEDNTSCDNLAGPITIPAGEFVIVSSHTETEFRAVWTTVPTGTIFVTSPSAVGNGLANSDELMLRNGTCTSGTIIDHISWGSNTAGLNPSIPSVPSDGISSERNPDGTDTDTNADFINNEPPTPGS